VRGRWIRERAATLVVAALLIATAGAFVWTERQKLQPPPFEVSEVTEMFSPVCRCERAAADIGLEFRRRTRLTLEIADEDGNVVRPLVSGVQDRGPVVIRWNGRDANGNVVAEGTYRPRARIGGNSRVFLLPNRIVVDTTEPHTTLARVEPKEVRASGRGRVELDYVLSERAQPLLYVNGRLHARGLARRRGKLDWFPRVRGVPLRPGRYRLQLAARDLAGNTGPLTRSVVVRVRR
jgi:FlgD Ig-like domain